MNFSVASCHSQIDGTRGANCAPKRTNQRAEVLAARAIIGKLIVTSASGAIERSHHPAPTDANTSRAPRRVCP